ncbi:hypothetical protein DL96DRAFT_1604333 [Flagelloscypha sp. PMI_526]|nr:hypothetical protein DL96DRAFT_1604333 [Flagelloscypha sp. PMI_526]
MSSSTNASADPFASPAVLQQVARIETVASAVRPINPSQRTSWAMAWLHLVVWNSWKSTYFYADKFPEDDFESYRQYALLSFTHLAEHHDAEEAYLFPTLEAKLPGTMDLNEKQHQSFLEPLTSIINYLNTTTEKTEFDSAYLKEKIEDILFPVMTHLADELDSLKADFLLTRFNETEIEQINKGTHQAQSGGDNSKMLPFVLQNLPPGTPFPPAPGFVKTIIAPWMMYWKYRPLWKYTTYPYSPTLEPVPTSSSQNSENDPRVEL